MGKTGSALLLGRPALFCCNANLDFAFLCHMRPWYTLQHVQFPASAHLVRPSLLGHSTTKGKISSVGWAIARHKEHSACRFRAWDKLPGWSLPQEQAVLSLFVSQEQLLLAAVRDE